MEKNQVYKVQIQADSVAEQIHNFWNHIHFHPTDAIEDDWGRNILDQISQDKAARYVRIYAMFEDVVYRDADGQLHYDFRDTDKRIDYLTEKGFRLLICFNFLPQAIAADPACISWLTRYKGKHINTSKPGDYREWQDICRIYTEHLKARYGEERLAEWYFHCWNEPDFPDYFLSDIPREGHMEEVAEEYARLYDHFAKGVSEGCAGVRIGGPSAALSNDFLERFLRHVKQGVNWADGGRGTRINFMSIHTYGAFPKDLAAGKPVRAEDTYRRVKELEKIAERCGFQGLEIVVDEWGLSTEGFTDAGKCPVLNFRNTEFYAAAYAHMICYYIAHHAPVSMQMICLSGQHNLKREFHGYRSFFTLHGFPKPIYNAYAICAKLGDGMLESRLHRGDGDAGGKESRLRGSGDGGLREGKDVCSEDGGLREDKDICSEVREPEGERVFACGDLRENEEWAEEQDGSRMGLLPTVDGKGRVAVLLYRFCPSAVMEEQKLRSRTCRHIHLEIRNLWGRYRIRHYRIDHGTCNAYTAWCELGRRDDLNQTELEWIRKEGALKVWYPEETANPQGHWQTDILMTDNAVSLVELEPMDM